MHQDVYINRKYFSYKNFILVLRNYDEIKKSVTKDNVLMGFDCVIHFISIYIYLGMNLFYLGILFSSFSKLKIIFY